MAGKVCKTNKMQRRQEGFLSIRTFTGCGAFGRQETSHLTFCKRNVGKPEMLLKRSLTFIKLFTLSSRIFIITVIFYVLLVNMHISLLQPTNFSNPIYDQFYSEDNVSELLTAESSSSEKKELLRGKKERNKIYLGDEERQPLGGHSSTDA